jgi:hypothetical protein
MKKAKVMLLAIAIIATVGTALAFKAQKLGSTKYCYTITEEEPPVGICLVTTVDAVAKPYTGGLKAYYTVTQTATEAACSEARCPNVAHTTFEE